jgi:purine-nucleoside phosphorylase|uniref:purine-nucleoside phosphorylase n=1 Tax=Candidatus Caldatribacterium californiense TaxID=1454726 RepID=A0A7V4DEW8_9BACT
MDRERALLRTLYRDDVLEYLQSVAGVSPLRPLCALVAGSGWGGCVEGETVEEFALARLHPSLCPGVPGHQGVLRFVRFPQGHLLVVEGRLHLYEGYGLPEVLLPITFARFLGVQIVILTNASGSLSPFLRPGNILVLSDQIDWTFIPDCFPQPVFDEKLRHLALREAWACGLSASEGVYVGVLGPSFETKAEIQMLGFLGGHAVGMSTVKESKWARGLGMKVLALSLVTNWGTGLSPSPLSHEEVLSLAEARKPLLRTFLHRVVTEILYENRCES